MADTELLPCPFCGEHLQGAIDDEGSFHTHPKNNCWYSEYEFDQIEVDKWNQRATPPSPSIAPEVDEVSLNESIDTPEFYELAVSWKDGGRDAALWTDIVDKIYDYARREVAAALASRPVVAEQAYDLAEAAGFSIQYLDGKHAFTGGIEQVERLLAFRPAEVDDASAKSGGQVGVAQAETRMDTGFQPVVAPAPEVDDEGLPALPESAKLTIYELQREPYFTAEQYRQGQRDAVAADRARRGSQP